MARLPDRVSVASLDDRCIAGLLSTPSKDFEAMKTPDAVIEGGALRSGGQAKLFSRQYIGLAVNYAAIGLIYGALPGTVYPFFQNYLNIEGYQINAASTLLSLPWSYKIFVGIVTDSFPIRGYRRRPYMVIGWIFCFLFIITMALMKVEDPFFKPEIRQKDRNSSDPNTILNPNAKHSGSSYVFLMMFAAVGYIIADVAADGMVVELAQRETLENRGQTQTTIYLIRTVFAAFAGILIGLGTNGKIYGGDFNFYIQFNGLMGIVSSFAAFALVSSIFCVHDEKVQAESFIERCQDMWKIGQKRAIWQIMIFQFVSSFLQSFTSTASTPIQSHWAGATNFNNAIFSVVGNFVFAGALWITQKYFLNTNWRYASLVTLIATVGIDAITTFLTIFDVFRSQWFWLGVPILEMLPAAVGFMVSCFVSVEVADVGYESTTYGLLTTIANLGSPFAVAISTQVNNLFDVKSKDISMDTPHVRRHVAYTYIFAYSMKLLSLVTLLILPKQKAEAQELKLNGGSSKPIAAICFGIAAFALVYSTVVNILGILPSTSCLPIAGGDGC